MQKEISICILIVLQVDFIAEIRFIIDFFSYCVSFSIIVLGPGLRAENNKFLKERIRHAEGDSICLLERVMRLDFFSCT